MPRFLCLTSHELDGPEYGSTLRVRNLLHLLGRAGEVRVVLASNYEPLIRMARSSVGGFELVAKVFFQPTTARPIADRLRHEFDSRFLDTDWCQARESDRQQLEVLMKEHDLVWIHRLEIANNFGIWRWPHSVLDIDDLRSGFFRSHLTQAAGVIESLRLYRRMVLWQRQEKHLAERFDAVCVCSEGDRQKLGGWEQVFVLPNGFTAPDGPIIRQVAVPPQIGFVGTFKYAPNRDGVRWFIQCVWPLILKNVPQARLRLVGEGNKDLEWRNLHNVDALGWIADVGSEMAKWALAVVPVLVGAGMRVKIAEAFSRRCPVVSTRLGAYGYDVVDGRDLLLADSSSDFAAKCLRILGNPTEGEAIAENAWCKFLEKWTWDAQAGRVAAIVDKILGSREIG